MKMFAKTIRSASAFLLVAALFLGVCGSPIALALESIPDNFVANIVDKDGNGIDYVALGDSMTNGYGQPGYYPRLQKHDNHVAEGNATAGGCIVCAYGGLYVPRNELWGGNVFGYLVNAPEAYPSKLADKLETALDTNVNLLNMAISGMRAEELHVLLDVDYSGDGYTGKLFTNDAAFWPEGCEPRFQWATAEGDGYGMSPAEAQALRAKVASIYGGDYSSLIGGITNDSAGTAKVRAEYQVALSNADLISIALGTNNFGTGVQTSIYRALKQAYGVELGDTTNHKYNLDALLEQRPDLKPAYEQLTAKLYATIETEMPEILDIFTMDSIKDIVETYTYGLLGFMVHYEASLELIRKLNPDATIVVIGAMNMEDGIHFVMDGKDIDFGGIYGTIVNAGNLWLADYVSEMDNVYYSETEELSLMVDEIAEGKFNNNTLSWMGGDLAENILKPVDPNNAWNVPTQSQWVSGLLNKYGYDVNEMPEPIKSKLQAVYDNPGDADALQAFRDQLIAEGANDVNKDQAGLSQVDYFTIAIQIVPALIEAAKDPYINLDNVTNVFKDNGFAVIFTQPERLWDEDVQDLLYFYARMMFGSGAGVHPSLQGHEDVATDVFNALKTGRSGKEDADNKREELTGEAEVFLKAYLEDKYPNIYEMMYGDGLDDLDDLAIIVKMLKMSGSAALKGVDLDELEADIREANKKFEESKTPEEVEAAQADVRELSKKLWALAVKVSGTKYEVNEDSFYVSLGDSNLTGFGLDGYEEAFMNGVGQYVEGSAPALLAQKLYGDNWKNQFAPYAQGGIRVEDMLYILGGNVEPDAYYTAMVAPNLLKGDIDATRKAYEAAIKNADLISFTIGGGNVTTFVGYQLQLIEAGEEALELDWAAIGYTDSEIAEIKEFVEMAVPFADLLGLMDKYVPEGMEIENPALFASVLLESMLYGYASYNYYYPMVLEQIRAINPDAQLLIVGMFNPVDDWTLTYTEDGEEKVINIGGITENVMNSANLQSLAYALQNDNTTFVDVKDATTFLDATGKAPTFAEYYSAVMDNNGKNTHADEKGHEYIYNQMLTAISGEGVATEEEALLEEFYGVLNDSYLTDSEKLELLGKLYSAVKAEGDLGDYTALAVAEEIYEYLDANKYITDAQTLAIVLEVYGKLLYDINGEIDNELNEYEQTAVVDFIYNTLIRNNKIDDEDRIAIIGNVYAILDVNFDIPAEYNKYAEVAENIYNELTKLGYLTDAEAMDIVDYVYVTLMATNGNIDTKEMREIAIYAYNVLMYGSMPAAYARGGSGGGVEKTPAEKLQIILTVYEELKDADVVNAESYPQLETLETLADELIFNEDALLTPEQSMAIIDAAFNTLVVEEKPAAEAVEVLTEVVANEVLNNPDVDPMVKLEIIDKVGEVVGELVTPEGGSGSESESTDPMATIAEYTQYIGIAKKVVANLKAEGLFDEHADAQFNALISTVIGILLKGEQIEFATLVETAFSMLFEQPGLTLEDKIRIVAVIYETLDEENLVIGGYDFFGDVDYLVTESEQLLKDLNTAILKNEALVVELKGNLETLNAELEVLVKDLNTKITELNKLENEVLATLVADRNALVAELLALEEKLVAVQNGTYGRAACADKEALVADTKAAIANTKAAIEELDATIAYVKNQIKTDKSGIEAIKANIAEIKANIAATETALAEVVAALDQLDADLVVLADAVKVLYQVSLGQFVEPEEILEAVITIAKVLPEIVDNVKELYEQGKELAEKVEVIAKDINESIVAINAAVEALNASAQAWVDVNVEKAEEIEATLVEIHELLKAFVNVNYPKVEEAVVDTVNEINALLEDYVKEDVLPLCEEYKTVALAVVGMAYLYAEDKGYIADLENLVEKYTAHAEAKLEELKPELEKAKVELEKAKAELEAKLPVWKEDLKQLKEDLLAEVDAEKAAVIEKAMAEIEAKIEAVENVIAEIEAFIAEVEAQIAAVEAALEAVKAAGEVVDGDIIALHEALKDLVKALKDLGCSVNELGENVVAEIEKLVNYGIMIHDDVVAVVDTLSVYCDLAERLEDVIVCEVEELINKIVEKQVNSLETLVEAIKDITCDKLDGIIDDIIYDATHGDYVMDNDSFYVALGDSSAVSESYVDALAAVLGVDYANLAQKGLTTSGTLALIEEQADVLAKADLVTVGFTANIFTAEVVATINAIMMDEEVPEYDWEALVTEDGVEYVEKALAEVHAKFVEQGLDVDFQGRNLADMLTACVEAYSYKYVEHLLTYPELVDAIHEVAPEALVVIVGMHNTIENIVIEVEGNEITLGDYIDYVVGAANIETLVYAILNENTIYVDAPAVETIKESKGDDLTYDMIAFVWEMLLTDGDDFATSEAGHAYITEQILNALNVVDNRTGLLGDANSDGVVDSTDAMLVLQYDALIIGKEALNLVVCDVDGDGDVDSTDAMYILQYDGLLIEVFPVEE